MGGPVVVPEPSTWAIMLVGLSAIAYARYRRRPFARNGCRADPRLEAAEGCPVLPEYDKYIYKNQK